MNKSGGCNRQPTFKIRRQLFDYGGMRQKHGCRIIHSLTSCLLGLLFVSEDAVRSSKTSISLYQTIRHHNLQYSSQSPMKKSQIDLFPTCDAFRVTRCGTHTVTFPTWGTEINAACLLKQKILQLWNAVPIWLATEVGMWMNEQGYQRAEGNRQFSMTIRGFKWRGWGLL